MEARLVLASASPRRRAILSAAGIPFEAVDPGGDGPPVQGSPAERVLAHARFKAAAVARAHPGRAVLGADTLVWLAGRPLGKPRDRAEAHAMLSALAGHEHEVWTGVCLLGRDGRSFEQADRARVAFAVIPSSELEPYLAGTEWSDKAGAYALQGAAGAWATVIEGDPETVIGLSRATVKTLIARAAACPPPCPG